MNKFICIHGHFYQPPRENPWLEAVELQDSAAPYHDWNQRVCAECYLPNAYARLLDANGRIRRIVSNYSQISFNFGPTLLSWMKDKAPDVYEAILEADKESQRLFSGHGSGLAQCYNHMIIPLANARDKRTQTLWGIRDFESRFKRSPEGMWLPETAADNASLDALAEQGIKFTILSPFQASRFRPLKGGSWRDANGGKIDPSIPYRVNLPSGRAITVFFYDAPVSKAVAFEQLLSNGGHFAGRLSEAFDPNRKGDQLVHIATDGESYGHHFRYGEMALAFALDSLRNNPELRLTVYGEFLERHPPAHEAEIHQSSAWSCPHGVDRWLKHCGCNSGGKPDWNQHWREPLRNALNWLRDQLIQRFESKAGDFLKDPWGARDDYISVILDKSPENIARYFEAHAARKLSEADQVTALRWLEMQRHAMLMFTSCGWFFDEISGIETVQVIQYAARAIQLAKDLLNEDLEPAFLEILANAKSNIREHQDGRAIYAKFVKPAIMTRESVGAHFAVSSLFDSYPEIARIYAFTVRQEDRQLLTAGKARLAVGRINVTFEITRNSDILTYGVLHMGDHNLNCGVRFDGKPEEYQSVLKDLREAFERADFAAIIRLMDLHFGMTHYSLKSLFRDEQRKILGQILAGMQNEIHSTYRQITDRYASLGRFLADIGAPAPKSLQVTIEMVLNSELRQVFESDNLDPERVRSLLAEAQSNKVVLESDMLGYALTGHLERLSGQFLKAPEDSDIVQRLLGATTLARGVPFDVNLWKPQNTYYGMLASVLPDMRQRAASGEETAKAWIAKFLALGGQLGFDMDHQESAEPAVKRETERELQEATAASNPAPA